ncbi:hypothetical protein [Deinococcus alpinitundrae]|uniref:hypothetical protein n=1 Tax=Deinococcus alpinitundrae TaxID=468913 RepID=UPI0013798D3E|nr:hypothetical protein [Deinococcus alpinitundrae]
MTSLTSPHIQTVLLDDLSLIWARFQNQSWVHADLTPFIERTSGTVLTDLNHFRAGRINSSGTHLQWPTGACLPLAELSIPLGQISPSGAFICRVSSHPHGWYRPLLAQYGDLAPWEYQGAADPATLLCDALHYSASQFQRLVASYPAKPNDLSARLLDLLWVLDPISLTHARHQLFAPWPVGRQIPHLFTPLSAIHHGRLALVEHILATRQNPLAVTAAGSTKAEDTA